MAKIIFYFSGTGNSFAVSRAIANKLRETELAPISQIRGYDIEKYETVGFVFPVYYIHAPEIVIKSLNNVKLSRSQQVFIVAAHGASYGYALSDVKCQLSQNNDVVIQEFRVNMPGNYILEYGANPLFYQKNVLRKAEKKIEKIVDDVLHNKPTKPIKPNLLAKLFRHNGDGKTEVFHKLGAEFETKDNCICCGICQEICPVGNISFMNGNVVWGNMCQQCMACIQWCPQNAITHPALKVHRKRYTHPDVSLEQLWRKK